MRVTPIIIGAENTCKPHVKSPTRSSKHDASGPVHVLRLLEEEIHRDKRDGANLPRPVVNVVLLVSTLSDLSGTSHHWPA